MTTTDDRTDGRRVGQLGQVISWRVPSEVRIETLREAMDASGFPPEMLRDMSHEQALRRGLREMRDGRVIRKFHVDERGNVHFQLTLETASALGVEYRPETQLELERSSGLVFGPDPEVVRVATALLVEHLGKRLTPDLSRLIQRIFERFDGDLIPIREAGGAYFVPDRLSGLVVQVRDLLSKIGGGLRSFSVRLGCDDTAGSVADSLSEYLTGLVGEFRESCAALHSRSRRDAVVNREERIWAIRQKLEGYRDLLGAYSDGIARQIEMADREMLERLSLELVKDAAVADADSNSDPMSATA